MCSWIGKYVGELVRACLVIWGDGEEAWRLHKKGGGCSRCRSGGGLAGCVGGLPHSELGKETFEGVSLPVPRSSAADCALPAPSSAVAGPGNSRAKKKKHKKEKAPPAPFVESETPTG